MTNFATDLLGARVEVTTTRTDEGIVRLVTVTHNDLLFLVEKDTHEIESYSFYNCKLKVIATKREIDRQAFEHHAANDTDEAPLDLRSPMRPQGVTAGFADYIQALKRINSFKGMGEPLNFEYQAGPILLADRVETVVKELEEARKETELRYTFDRNNVIAKAKRDANPTLMMNDAARALGWRTDFACGDSPISWDLVLDGIEDEVITKQVAHKLLVQISNAPGVSTSVKGWIIEYIAKRTERQNEQNIQHERRIDLDQKLERLASMRTLAVTAAHEALINLSKTIRSGPEHEHSWRETVDGLARTILAIFEES